MNPSRTRKLNEMPVKDGPIVYWMQRDQRVDDNWALLYAQELAIEREMPLVVVFCLAPSFLDATNRHYQFMVKGLTEVEEQLNQLQVPFFLLEGNPMQKIPAFVERMEIGALIADFNPLRLTREWRDHIAQSISVAMVEVDAHNIIPCWISSGKVEFGARTIRGKIQRLVPEYLVEFPQLKPHPFAWNRSTADAISDLGLNQHVREIGKGANEKALGGALEAKKVLARFIQRRLFDYDEVRNYPDKEGQSGLSPYFHFGQISPQRVALEVSRANSKQSSKEAYLEELIVRRELSDNYCYYNPLYDQFEGFPAWAQKTLNQHRVDSREFLYSITQFELAETHDPLWNAAQRELTILGKMHGYMRMYWAKKILEWTGSPEEALAICIYLNDKYSYDGRDPNGYVGVAWSIGGVHDRPWGERPVFGQIRYMNFNGCARKFDVKAYIAKISALQS